VIDFNSEAVEKSEAGSSTIKPQVHTSSRELKKPDQKIVSVKQPESNYTRPDSGSNSTMGDDKEGKPDHGKIWFWIFVSLLTVAVLGIVLGIFADALLYLFLVGAPLALIALIGTIIANRKPVDEKGKRRLVIGVIFAGSLLTFFGIILLLAANSILPGIGTLLLGFAVLAKAIMLLRNYRKAKNEIEIQSDPEEDSKPGGENDGRPDYGKIWYWIFLSVMSVVLIGAVLAFFVAAGLYISLIALSVALIALIGTLIANRKKAGARNKDAAKKRAKRRWKSVLLFLGIIACGIAGFFIAFFIAWGG
jgi:hypothetical protein